MVLPNHESIDTRNRFQRGRAVPTDNDLKLVFIIENGAVRVLLSKAADVTCNGLREFFNRAIKLLMETGRKVGSFCLNGTTVFCQPGDPACACVRAIN